MAVDEKFEDDSEATLAMTTDFKNCQYGVFSIGKMIKTNGPHGSGYEKESNGLEDDELTSLTWLQDTNLLKNFRMGNCGIEGEDGLSDSPSSDFLDESMEHVALNLAQRELNVESANLSGHLPYNPTLHANSKPPFSFSCLIFMAIEDSLNKALPVKDIYNWILNHFPYFQNAPTGWKNSVRHNLSLSKCFRKVEKEKGQNVGKGSLWCIDPEFRPNLLQALQKAPNMANVEFSHFSCIPSSFFNKGKSENDVKPCLLVSSQQALKIPSPELFPYLSRRLASSIKDPEVDAAATMLTLKNGPNMTTQNLSEESESDSLSSIKRFPRKRLRYKQLNHSGNKRGKASPPVITNSPSEDHTYSACLNQQNYNSPCASPMSEEMQSWSEDSKSTFEDTGPTANLPFSVTLLKNNGSKSEDEDNAAAEGANALMNLAKIAAKRLLRSSKKKS